VEGAIKENDLTVSAVLSGNRNFEGRVHPFVKFSYLASPPLVVAFALAGTVDIDVYNESLGTGTDGDEVYLKDIWPTQPDVRETVDRVLNPEIFRAQYSRVFDGDDTWQSLPVPEGNLYDWDDSSTYIREPNFFDDFSLELPETDDIKGAHALAILGHSITTDHISPAGAIPKEGPAGRYLISKGVEPREFNSFGSRRHVPTNEELSIYDASTMYQKEGTPLIVLGGKEYGTGSSRDWAAKGTNLLGVKAVIAESFERIHRSNLVGMGVLPLQFKEGESAETFDLTGYEKYDIDGIAQGLVPGQEIQVRITRPDGGEVPFNVICRLDSPVEVDYYKNGGILQTVLRQMISG
jgi:aconitate hydratase